MIEIVDWRGDTGSLLFHRHPHENDLVEIASVASGLNKDDLYAFSRTQGYLAEETDYFLDFLLLRGYLERDSTSGRFVLATTFTQDELISIARSILDEHRFVQELNPNYADSTLGSQVKSLHTDLEQGTVDLSDAQVRLVQHQRVMQQTRQNIVKDLRTTLQTKIELLYRYKARFIEPLPESVAGLLLDAHINGAQRTLQELAVQAAIRIEKRVAAMRNIAATSLEIDTTEFPIFKDYAVQLQRQIQFADDDERRLKPLIEQYATHHDWIQLISRLKRLADMLKAAGEITDIGLLKQNWERIQWDMQQELASEGLKRYRAIYNQFVSPISEMQNELEMLVRLAQARQERRETTLDEHSIYNVSSNGHDHRDELSALPAWIKNDGLVNLSEMFTESTEQSDAFLQYLIDLNEKGDIVVYWRRNA